MQGGFEVSFLGEAGGGTTGEVVVAAEAEGAGSAGELVEAVEVKGVKGVIRGEGFAGIDSAAFASASEGGSGVDGGRRDAQAVADEEDELGVGEEGAFGDGVAKEEGCGTSDSAGEDAGDGVRGSMGGNADGGFVTGECMG